jgi:hypothetical protein
MAISDQLVQLFDIHKTLQIGNVPKLHWLKRKKQVSVLLNQKTDHDE